MTDPGELEERNSYIKLLAEALRAGPVGVEMTSEQLDQLLALVISVDDASPQQQLAAWLQNEL